MSARRFPYVARDKSLAAASLAPIMPLILTGTHGLSVTGLVDSGAAVNVLPYTLGRQLGFVCSQQTRTVDLSGNLSTAEARVVVVSALVADFAPVRLAFAWTNTDDVSVLLGQVNFFLEFDVCFFRSANAFEVKPKQ